MNERVDENIHILPQPRTGQKPNYLQQEVLDKAIEDGERRLMERKYIDCRM